eukprot:1808454-Pleurochrysis_carterae.AAC.2
MSLGYALLATFSFGLYASYLHYFAVSRIQFGIPGGGGTGALITLSLSRSQASRASPEPDRVRGVSGYQYLSFTHYNPAEGGRSSLSPGKGLHTR